MYHCLAAAANLDKPWRLIARQPNTLDEEKTESADENTNRKQRPEAMCVSILIAQ
jgi:hypothetical protein